MSRQKSGSIVSLGILCKKKTMEENNKQFCLSKKTAAYVLFKVFLTICQRLSLYRIVCM